jgi:hypothetical protein
MHQCIHKLQQWTLRLVANLTAAAENKGDKAEGLLQ